VIPTCADATVDLDVLVGPAYTQESVGREPPCAALGRRPPLGAADVVGRTLGELDVHEASAGLVLDGLEAAERAFRHCTRSFAYSPPSRARRARGGLGGQGDEGGARVRSRIPQPAPRPDQHAGARVKATSPDLRVWSTWGHGVRVTAELGAFSPPTRDGVVPPGWWPRR